MFDCRTLFAVLFGVGLSQPAAAQFSDIPKSYVPGEKAAVGKQVKAASKPDSPLESSPPSHPATAAKQVFGAVKLPAALEARAIGSYARGCLAGATPLPIDGPSWQAMRLSRNRNWGHPSLIALIERLAADAKAKDGWPGLLVGDMSQPRGGPMLTGHASHQIGLDADVWLTPMPDKRLSHQEREKLEATSMLDTTELAVDPGRFTPRHVALIKRAASYPEVERVLVHPAIKKALCEKSAPADRSWLAKVRPYYGHYYHMHVRIGCPKGSAECAPQAPTPHEDTCGKELDDWFKLLVAPPKPPGPPTPPITVEQLPAACKVVLGAPAVEMRARASASVPAPQPATRPGH